jgi:DNA invertase Pin-like site-specific DNA recombinase
MTTSAPRRVVLYARVSTVDRGQDPELQLTELRLYAGQRGWQVVAECTDHASGSDRHRPGLAEAMALVMTGKADMVIVWRFDRFARSTSHLLAALEQFQGAGVDFVSVREQIDTTTPMGKAMFTITAAVAELERDLIRERVRAGVARAQAAGKHCGRPAREVNLHGAEALLAGGMSMRQVAQAVHLPESTLRRRMAATRQKSVKEAGM